MSSYDLTPAHFSSLNNSHSLLHTASSRQTVLLTILSAMLPQLQACTHTKATHLTLPSRAPSPGSDVPSGKLSLNSYLLPGMLFPKIHRMAGNSSYVFPHPRSHPNLSAITLYSCLFICSPHETGNSLGQGNASPFTVSPGLNKERGI